MRDVLPVDQHAPFFRHEESQDELERRRFPGAGLAHDHDGLAFPGREGDVLEDGLIERQEYVIHLDDGRRFRRGDLGLALLFPRVLPRVLGELLTDRGAHVAALSVTVAAVADVVFHGCRIESSSCVRK